MKTSCSVFARNAAIWCAALLLTACQHVSKSIKDTFNTRPEEPFFSANRESVARFVADEDALARAEQQLRELPQYRSRSINLYADIHFYDDGRIAAKLQHPENMDYVDAYTYRQGKWSGPHPVQLSARERLSDKMIALDSVPFRTAAAVIRNYNEKAAAIEGARQANHVYLIIHSGLTRWYPNRIDGARELWQISFRRDGSVTSFERL
ncbi:hypothetical protein JHJ32_21025 [Parapedobacter sp. ISTM3]|nr:MULTISPECIES: hypothetical protein [Parapedobacter]MBK1442495.1 hypothetical protein [Parapedobacter sp. ISTM3]